jgi:hypothetical protein
VAGAAGTSMTTPVPATPAVKDGHFFRRVMQRQHARLFALCKEWQECGDVEAAVCIGQARLLMAQRFVQYGELCDSFDGARVGSSDLEGFWEVIMYQVNEVIVRFERLTNSKVCVEFYFPPLVFVYF